MNIKKVSSNVSLYEVTWCHIPVVILNILDCETCKCISCFMFVGDMKFPEMNVKITPNTPKLVDVYPSSFKVCGHVAPFKVILGASERGPVSVVFSKDATVSESVIVEAQQETGEFCVFLESGKYEARVKLTEWVKISRLQ